MTYESAERWNAANPPGTPVRLTLRDGRVITTKTAGRAQQWGSLALLRLKGDVGVWTVRGVVPDMTSTIATLPE